MSEITHAAVEKTILSILPQHEGEGQKVFINRIQADHPTVDRVAISGVLHRLAQDKRIFRTRVLQHAKLNGIYRVWSQPQPDATPQELQVVTRRHQKYKYEPHADSPICKNCGHAWGDHSNKSYCPPQPKAEKAEKAKAVKSAPVVSAQFPQHNGTAHPVRKPGTLTMNLEMPDGTIAAFTLDELMRMYAQINRMLESVRATAGL